MIIDDDSATHEWRYSRGDIGNSHIVFTHSHELCSDVVEEFAHYLLAVGFFQSSIIEAFEDYVDDHKIALINSSTRMQRTMVEESESGLLELSK